MCKQTDQRLHNNINTMGLGAFYLETPIIILRTLPFLNWLSQRFSWNTEYYGTKRTTTT